MLSVIFNNITNLNNSLQVGDLIYSSNVSTQFGADDPQNFLPVGGGGGGSNIVGILRRIRIQNGSITLDIDETPFFGANIPQAGDFLMFSKYDQTDGDVSGYYAQAKFANNSTEKAELFSVGSEVVINSK